MENMFKKVDFLKWKMPKIRKNSQNVLIAIECHETIFFVLLYETNRFHFAVRPCFIVDDREPFCFCHILTSSVIKN